SRSKTCSSSGTRRISSSIALATTNCSSGGSEDFGGRIMLGSQYGREWKISGHGANHVPKSSFWGVFSKVSGIGREPSGLGRENPPTATPSHRTQDDVRAS